MITTKTWFLKAYYFPKSPIQFFSNEVGVFNIFIKKNLKRGQGNKKAGKI